MGVSLRCVGETCDEEVSLYLSEEEAEAGRQWYSGVCGGCGRGYDLAVDLEED